MYSNLLDFLRERPEEYAESTRPFWDDDHISQYMLNAHLDPSPEEAARRQSFICHSTAWVAEIADPAGGKSLLALSCGPGLYTEAFDELGFRVTGMDLSRCSVEYARQSAEEKEKDIRYFHRDYFTEPYPGSYDVITLIYCNFGVLKPEQRAALLERARSALNPGGCLILDGYTPVQYEDFQEGQNVFYAKRGFWCETPYTCIEGRFRYGEAARAAFLEQYIIVTDNACDCYNMWSSSFDSEALEEALREAGFSDITLFGDVCGSKLAGRSKTICAVAR